jgi:hypothetical protein
MSDGSKWFDEVELAPAQALVLLEEAEALCDFAENVEEEIENLVDGSVYLQFPKAEDITYDDPDKEYTIKLMVDGHCIYSSCGSHPFIVLHQIRGWARATLGGGKVSTGDA